MSQYNPEVGSNTYLLFAVASAEAYGLDPKKEKDIRFRVREYAKPDIWEKQKTLDAPTGMHADIYYHKTGDYLDVLIAFRGTRGPSLQDWYSNLAPVTQIIPVSNAYTSASALMPAIIKKAKDDAGDLTVRFVATGHSLGGGLAQHVAQEFPCFSAVTFDSSCVVQASGPKLPVAPKIVNIYEKGDELTHFCKFAAGVGESDDYRQFNVNVISKGLHHRAMGFVVGMSRMVAECQVMNPACDIKLDDRRSYDLYCGSYGKIGYEKICDVKYRPKFKVPS